MKAMKKGIRLSEEEREYKLLGLLRTDDLACDESEEGPNDEV